MGVSYLLLNNIQSGFRYTNLGTLLLYLNLNSSAIPQTQDDTPTSSRNTTPEVVVIPQSQGDNLRQNTGKKYYL